MSFSMDLSRFADKAKLNMDAVVRKVVIDVGMRIVKKSPVGDGTLWQSPPPAGYVGGRFRANWQYGFDTMPTEQLEDIDASGGKSISRITVGAARSPTAGLHYLVNNLPYAKRLENGWSSQAPAGMVALTALEFSSIADKATAETNR